MFKIRNMISPSEDNILKTLFSDSIFESRYASFEVKFEFTDRSSENYNIQYNFASSIENKKLKKLIDHDNFYCKDGFLPFTVSKISKKSYWENKSIINIGNNVSKVYDELRKDLKKTKKDLSKNTVYRRISGK